MNGQQKLENYAKEIAKDGDDYKKVIIDMAGTGYNTGYNTWAKVRRSGSEVIVTKITRAVELDGDKLNETVELTISA
jgi:hypothetical protein